MLGLRDWKLKIIKIKAGASNRQLAKCSVSEGELLEDVVGGGKQNVPMPSPCHPHAIQKIKRDIIYKLFRTLRFNGV